MADVTSSSLELQRTDGQRGEGRGGFMFCVLVSMLLLGLKE